MKFESNNKPASPLELSVSLFLSDGNDSNDYNGVGEQTTTTRTTTTTILSPLDPMNHDYDENEVDEFVTNEIPSTSASYNANEEELYTTPPPPPPTKDPKAILYNFILLSILFSANHGAVVSCLSAATARLGGDLGSWQSSLLYLSYTLTALFGATLVVKHYGGRNSMIMGMFIYCIYVGCFALATSLADGTSGEYVVVFVGAVWGGVGGGLIWTAQGSYFVRASEEYTAAKKNIQQQRQQQQQQQQQHENHNNEEENFNEEEKLQNEEEENENEFTLSDASSIFGGIFASIYLLLELILRLFSTIMLQAYNWSWHRIYIGYTIIAFASTLGMTFIINYHRTAQEERENEATSIFYKATVTWRLLYNDCKMKYMIFLNAVFGFTAAFVTSFVSGEVLRISLNDDRSIHVGVMTSITSAVAAVCSLLFGWVNSNSKTKKMGNKNGCVLVLGCIASFCIALLFVVRPSIDMWNTGSLVVVYCLQGVGRATFEGTLRAEFAVLFEQEKEGAFGNIPFQFGTISMIGFALTTGLHCSPTSSSSYCIQYENGTHHDMLAFEIIIMSSAVLAVLGYWRARVLYRQEQENTGKKFTMLVQDDHLV